MINSINTITGFEYNSLPFLVEKAAVQYKNRCWYNARFSSAGYSKADVQSDAIASYLIRNGYTRSSYLYISSERSYENTIVCLAAIKAGMLLSDTSALPESILNKKPLSFSNGTFSGKEFKMSFREALKEGGKTFFIHSVATFCDEQPFGIFSIAEEFTFTTHDDVHQRIVSSEANLPFCIEVMRLWLNGKQFG